GPEAQQLATYIGWLMHRTTGGVIAGVLFVLPGAIAIMALSWIYVLFGNVGIVAGLFFGLKAAVLAVVLEAVIRVGRRALRGPVLLAIAGLAFVLIFFLSVPFPLIIVGAAVAGFAGGRAGLSDFVAPAAGAGADAGLLGDTIPDHARPGVRQALLSASVCLALWLIPVAGLVFALGPANVFSALALFFSKMALVTFGGAYAVLAYVAQQAVDTYGWLRPGEMLDGLGMAETTPGPLIMVV